MLGDNKHAFRKFETGLLNIFAQTVNEVASKKLPRGNNQTKLSEPYETAVLSALIAHAENSVSVITETLAPHKNEKSVVIAARYFLRQDQNNQIRILLTNPNIPLIKQSAFAYLKSEFPEQIKLKVSEREWNFPFALADDRGFLMRHPGEIETFAFNFNEPEITEKWKKIFDEHFDSLPDIPLHRRENLNISKLEQL